MTDDDFGIIGGLFVVIWIVEEEGLIEGFCSAIFWLGSVGLTVFFSSSIGSGSSINSKGFNLMSLPSGPLSLWATNYFSFNIAWFFFW